MKRIWIAFLALVMVLGMVQFAAAVPTVSLHEPENEGITAIRWSYSDVTRTFSIWEIWGASGIGFLEFDGLTQYLDYTVVKYITNNTGTDWTAFSNELLDPSGDQHDTDWDTVTEAWVPTGFSHSSEYDGLSFAQGSGIPRTSAAFPDLFTDEVALRDYIDFSGAIVSGSGGVDTITYGLRDNGTLNQPFLLAQRPNELVNRVPEPSTLLLLGSGLLGLVGFGRKFKV